MSCGIARPDPDARRLGAACSAVGVLAGLAASAVVVGAVIDPFADVSESYYLSRIASAPHLWLAVHLTIAVAVVAKLVGLLGIGEHLDGTGRSTLVRVANTLAALGSTLFVVTMVFDGYVHAYLARRWHAAPAARRPQWADLFGASLRTSYGLEIAALLVLLGLAPIAYGVAMRRNAAFPVWLARLGVGGGAGAVVTAVVLWLGGPSVAGYGVLYPIFAVVVPAVWLLAAARHVWRTGASPVDAAPGGLVATARAATVVTMPAVTMPAAAVHTVARHRVAAGDAGRGGRHA